MNVPQPDAAIDLEADAVAAYLRRHPGFLGDYRVAAGTAFDFDGNGVRDLAIGADFAARGGAQNGEVTVALFGRLASTIALDGPSAVRPGEEATFSAVVAKPAGDPSPVASGTVAFALAGAPIAGCGAVPVSAGTATC